MQLQAAATVLGVHYQTAYQWVRDGTLPAVKLAGCYEVRAVDVERLRRVRSRPAPPPQRATVRDWGRQVDRLRSALLAGDERAGREVVDRLCRGGVPALDLCERLFTPVLRDIGEGWAAGRVSVAEEHRASAICERLLARTATQPRGRPRGTCVVATAPGERHGLPATMAALCLRADRWRVHHLGIEVPVDDLVALAARTDATVVVLSSTEASGGSTAAAAEAVQAAGHPVLAGGAGSHLRDLLSGARALSWAESPIRSGNDQRSRG